MVVKRRMGLLLSGTLLSASVAAAVPAFAEDAQSQQQMQQQINTLQQQLQQLQDQMAATRAVPRGIYNDAPGGPIYTKAPPILPGVKFSFAGSFIEAAAVWRQRNEVSDGASDPPFSSLPFPNSPLYHEGETRFSGRQSRIAFAATGDIDPHQHLQAYYEMDFLGAGVTANSRESNSYQPRIRQAFVAYDNDDWHLHISGGQMWSLLTQDRVGMLPRSENVPLTIDAQYVVGFNWARTPSFRFVQDWNKVAWFGFSVESPQVNFVSNSVGVLGASSQTGSSANLATGAVTVGTTSVGGSTVPPGVTLNDINVCNASGLLDSTTGCSTDQYPDLVQKFGLDPGWGHFEAVGLERFFSDRVYSGAPVTGSDKTKVGWGVGGSALMPIWPKFVDLQGSILYGQGLGRYGSSQLPDVTIGPDGTLQPLRTLQALVGFVAHPWEGLDVYGYAGQEQVFSNFWTVGGVNGGYGNPAFANTGCIAENMGSGPAGFNDPIAGTSCSGATNVQRTQELTIGFWQNIYKGNFGRFVYGLQYEYVRLQPFGAPAGLNVNNNVVFASLRYYPF